MFDGFYPLNLEINKVLTDLQDVKTTDHLSRGLDITRTLNGVVQNTANQAVYINAHTPDGRNVFAQAEVIDTNVGHYMLTYPDAMINVVGIVTFELTIIDPTGTLSTNNGTINVVQAVSNYSDTINDPNYPALLQALNDVQGMQAQLTAMQLQVDNIEKFETGSIIMSPIALDTRFWIPLNGQLTTGFDTLSPIYGANFPNMNGKTGVQIDTAQTEFNTLGKIGGEKTHLLAITEIPAHIHNLGMYACIKENRGHYSAATAKQSGGFQDRVIVTGNSSYTGLYMSMNGGSQSHNNLQPYGVLGKYYVHI